MRRMMAGQLHDLDLLAIPMPAGAQAGACNVMMMAASG
jgi:hypothetical protein